jgi:hypothetical protein
MTEQELREVQPRTPTEFALLNEIKRLTKENYLLRIEANMYPRRITQEPYEIDAFPTRHKIELLEGARLIANIESGGTMRVMQKGFAKDGETFGASYYVSHLEARTSTADLMHELHRRNMRVLGDFVYKGGKG